MNDVLERRWKEAVSHYLPGATKEHPETCLVKVARRVTKFLTWDLQNKKQDCYPLDQIIVKCSSVSHKFRYGLTEDSSE
jgi:hypothetical protein